jgi:hypothetical protein
MVLSLPRGVNSHGHAKHTAERLRYSASEPARPERAIGEGRSWRWHSRLAMSGGIDKRALAQGRSAIDAELAAKMPVTAQGGYVPTVDHALPPDITLANFRYYMERKWEWVERIGGGG